MLYFFVFRFFLRSVIMEIPLFLVIIIIIIIIIVVVVVVIIIIVIIIIIIIIIIIKNIIILLMWLCFVILPLEHFTVGWLLYDVVP